MASSVLRPFPVECGMRPRMHRAPRTVRAYLSGMPILYFVIVVALVGLVTWAATTYIPMPTTIKRIIIVVVAIAVVLWTLQL
jgi:hypothetical protein